MKTVYATAAAIGAPGHLTRDMLRHVPPEGVPITFKISSLGARMGAQMLDLLFTFGTVLLLMIGLVYIDLLTWNGLMAFFALSTFFVRIPYYIVSELVWNGRTLGKRVLGIRVISLDGRRLTPHQIVARNVMKEVELFLPVSTLFGAPDMNPVMGTVLVIWMLGILIVPFANLRRQRLGDMMAGTVVIDNPRPQLLPDLSAAQAAGLGYEFQPGHLAIYGRHELETLEGLLRSPPPGKEGQAQISRVVEAIRKCINYEELVPEHRETAFLMDFYRQQREYLESRNLFGDTRASKFHISEDKPGGFQFQTRHLDIYGESELGALQTLLDEAVTTVYARERLTQAAKAIHTRIAYDEPVSTQQEISFLRDFHRQQKAYLQARRLTGEVRSDKHHTGKSANHSK